VFRERERERETRERERESLNVVRRKRCCQEERKCVRKSKKMS
jgi:hypothetical protein